MFWLYTIKGRTMKLMITNWEQFNQLEKDAIKGYLKRIECEIEFIA